MTLRLMFSASYLRHVNSRFSPQQLPCCSRSLSTKLQQQKKVGDPIPAPSPPGGKEQPPVEALPPKNEKPFAPPAADNSVRQFSDKIVSLVDQIAGLSLLEVADLNALLKKRLNLPDQPMMAMAAGMMASPAGDRQKAKEEEAEAPVAQKAFFTLKLVGFDEAKKIAVIKEVKNHVAGLNLVQAKKFVESPPQVIKADISKADAEKLKATLEATGAKCEIE